MVKSAIWAARLLLALRKGCFTLLLLSLAVIPVKLPLREENILTGQSGMARNGFGFRAMTLSMPGAVVSSFPSSVACWTETFLSSGWHCGHICRSTWEGSDTSGILAQNLCWLADRRKKEMMPKGVCWLVPLCDETHSVKHKSGVEWTSGIHFGKKERCQH